VLHAFASFITNHEIVSVTITVKTGLLVHARWYFLDVVANVAPLAPGPLGLVQEFVNTLEMGPDGNTETLGTPEALAGWLVERGLADAVEVAPGDHAGARGLREALRRLLLANNGHPVHDDDLAVLNATAAAAGLRPRFVTGGRVVLEPDAGGVPGALGRLLAAVSEAMNNGSWSRLKACGDPSCQGAFYDRSKNHSGHWCSMEVCGNRAKARVFRQRRRAVTGTR
jgi:predicted RNA-binding Zn ribbon-like protein